MIGEKLSELLEAKNMKAGTLANQAGIPKSTIYSIIKRNNKSVEFSVIERISDVLGVPIEYFYDRDASPNSAENEKKAAPEIGSGQISAAEIEGADIIRNLSPEKQQEALRYLRYLAESEDT